MRLPNSYGGISKLSGKRRRPYCARLTVGWELDSTTGRAKQIYKPLGYYATRREALQALAEYHQNPIDLTKKDITFEEVWAIWSPKHFEKYPSSTKPLQAAYKKCSRLYKMAVKDIRKIHLQRVMDSLAGMSETSQVKVRTVFSKTFKYCLENDIVTKDYSAFVELSGAVKTDSSNKFFTKDEVMRLLELATPDEDHIVIMLYTGIRIGELLAQKTADVDLENRVIHVRGTKTENADRIVPIHKDLVSIIERNMGGKYLIERKGKPISYRSYARDHYKPFMEKLGVKHTPHALRHTFVSLMDASGVSANSVVLKRIVGHSDTTVTHLYTHKSVEDLIEAIDKLVMPR